MYDLNFFFFFFFFFQCLSYEQLKDLIVRLYEVIVRAQVKALAALQSIDSLDSRRKCNICLLNHKFCLIIWVLV